MFFSHPDDCSSSAPPRVFFSSFSQHCRLVRLLLLLFTTRSRRTCPPPGPTRRPIAVPARDNNYYCCWPRLKKRKKSREKKRHNHDFLKTPRQETRGENKLRTIRVRCRRSVRSAQAGRKEGYCSEQRPYVFLRLGGSRHVPMLSFILFKRFE